MTPQQMNQLVKQAFSALPLSRTEKAALEESIQTASMNEVQLAAFRSKAFQLATGAVNANNGAEVIQWLDDVTKLLQRSAPETSQELAEAWFSPHPDCPRRIRALLAEARSSVDICVFTITDDRLTSGVLEAFSRGVKVRIITDNDKAADLGSDADELLRAGVALRVDRSEYHMHHKFAVFDRRILLNGSYNWTRGAAENNEENFVITDNTRLVAPFIKTFEKLWEHAQA